MQIITKKFPFTIEQLCKSDTAIRKGIKNVPGEEEIKNLNLLIENILIPIYTQFGNKLTITSCFRSPELCTAIGSKPTSQHAKGQAVDCEIIGYSNKLFYDWCKDFLTFDQLILEYHKDNDPQSGWVHISYNKSHNRKQELRIS